MEKTRNDRREARILTMQALCQLDVQGPAEADGVLAIVAHEDDDHPPSPGAIAYARGLLAECWTSRSQLDEMIAGAAENWDPQRMPIVDRNILRVAVCELAMRTDVPAPVAINEAVEIAKEFGSAETPGFVNGVLDKVSQNRKSQTS